MHSFAQMQSTDADVSPKGVHVDATQCISACSACPAYEFGLCAAVMKKAGSEAERYPGPPARWSSVQTISPRRTICHPSEWPEFIPVICSGWATSSVALPDGRRQILSFLLVGELASLAGLFEPMPGLLVEAVTNVTYRTFKREELRTVLFGHGDMFEKLAGILNGERKQADELAVDLGRRTAEERLARLILRLMERLATRGMVQDQTMEFPLRQRQIADATGLTPVHVSKVLGEFHRANLIQIKDRSLTILNLAELRRVADHRGINVHFRGHRAGPAKAKVV